MSQFEFTKILYLWVVIFVVAMNVDGIVIIIHLPLNWSHRGVAFRIIYHYHINYYIAARRLFGLLAAKL